MSRRSKLTESQWDQIERRVLAGESRRALAREFGITEGAIRQQLSTRISEANSLAHQIVDTERRLAVLPMSTQINTRTLADRLRSISDHLASAAEYGAMTAHRLQALANSEVQKVDDAEPLASLEALRGVQVLTKLANESAQTGLNLLTANKKTVEDNNRAPVQELAPVEDVPDTQLARIVKDLRQKF